MNIGGIELSSNVIAAPMAGVSDRPYRALARKMGAALAVSEMLTSQLQLRETAKTRFRMDIDQEQEPVSIQLVGTEPSLLADAAKFNIDKGAHIIDINMGCPAKKVCKKKAGSALLGDTQLVKHILESVVAAVDVPVTLKFRTGLDIDNRNAIEIAHIAENSGIQALTLHGRTRQCKFVGQVEYDTITAVKDSVSIPVVANGDIDSPEKALYVLQKTNADAIMIGRAAQGRPWIFSQIVDYLDKQVVMPEPSLKEKKQIILQHITEIHHFYGEQLGVRLARKHIAWYLNNLEGDFSAKRYLINQQESVALQYEVLEKTLESAVNFDAEFMHYAI